MTHLPVEPAPRRAARLVVVDEGGDAVWLVQYEDEGRRWWATPGGGLEGAESFEEAAAREAFEELGVEAPRLEPLWGATVAFTFRGAAVRQEERYFLLRLARDAVRLGADVRAAHQREGIAAARWWTLADLERTTEQVFPEDLARRVRALGAAPERPHGRMVLEQPVSAETTPDRRRAGEDDPPRRRI